MGKQKMAKFSNILLITFLICVHFTINTLETKNLNTAAEFLEEENKEESNVEVTEEATEEATEEETEEEPEEASEEDTEEATEEDTEEEDRVVHYSSEAAKKRFQRFGPGGP